MPDTMRTRSGSMTPLPSCVFWSGTIVNCDTSVFPSSVESIKSVSCICGMTSVRYLPTECQDWPSQKYRKEDEPSEALTAAASAPLRNTAQVRDNSPTSGEDTALVAVVDLHSSNRTGEIVTIAHRRPGVISKRVRSDISVGVIGQRDRARSDESPGLRRFNRISDS